MAYTRAIRTHYTLFLIRVLLFSVIFVNGFYIDHEKPEVRAIRETLRFNVEKKGPVGMFIHNSTVYDPTTPEGLKAFEHLVPSGGHVVHIYSNDRNSQQSRYKAYTIALFHRLKCLEIISKKYAHFEQPLSPLTTHCMNYLRQSILCRLNLRLESVKDTHGYIEDGGYDTKCNDWSAVYEEAERNHHEYLRLTEN